MPSEIDHIDQGSTEEELNNSRRNTNQNHCFISERHMKKIISKRIEKNTPKRKAETQIA